MSPSHRAIFILYVRDQDAAAAFYRAVLDIQPSLDVPGMTEFPINTFTTLGLMPSDGIKRLLGDALPDPNRAHGVPRAELYLLVDNPQEYLERAMRAGAKLLSPVLPRDWGDTAGYCLDPDGHVLAFATRG